MYKRLGGIVSGKIKKPVAPHVETNSVASTSAQAEYEKKLAEYDDQASQAASIIYLACDPSQQELIRSYLLASDAKGMWDALVGI